MVEQLGPPTIFFTLSAADIHWPEMYEKICAQIQSAETDRIRYNCDLLNKNPMEFAYWFSIRAKKFLRKVMYPLLDIVDSWYRIEFQHRGSPHVHGVLWLNNAPDVTYLNSINDQEEQNQEFKIAIDFFDNIINSMNPNQNITYSSNPCIKKFSEIADSDHLIDYCELLNYCQIHKETHTKTCFKKNSSVCRFGFPKELHNESKIILNQKNNQLEFISKRNDCWLNNNNRELMELWRANMDVSSILSVYAIIYYIAKYTTQKFYKSKNGLNACIKF